MESTLSLTKDDLEGALGDFLGYGMGTANGEVAWDTRTQNRITADRHSGERQFYHPALEGMPYVWSFLRPVATLTLPAGQSLLPLPDDFGGIEGEITATTPNSRMFSTVAITGDVRPQSAANPTLTGRPLLADVEPIKGTTALGGQRDQLYIFPIADQNYTLQFAYYVNPDAMSGVRPYALGGMQHAETLLAACIAAAELFRDDMKGPRFEYFQERLQASINMDRRLKPQLLGYNRDHSDLRESHHYGYPWNRWGGATQISYNGVDYT